MLKDKWKVFAMRQCFSNEMTEVECVKHFDVLSEREDADDLDNYMQGLSLIPWRPFELMCVDEFADHVAGLAADAQNVEGAQL